MAEVKTREFDAESMRYLSYLLYPIVIGGAMYSLLYQPHKRYVNNEFSFLLNLITHSQKHLSQID